MNLVISTTFGWNIGDQFVLAGVKAALALGWDGLLRYVYHDRNPERLPSGGMEAHEAIRCGWADALVIAGTPGWTLECLDIYQTAIEHGVPIYMIGIGAGADTGLLLYQVENNEVLKAALAAAPLIICRDEICRDVVSRFTPEAHLLPCPAILNGLKGHAMRDGRELVAMGEHYHGPYDRDGLVAHSVADLQCSGGRAFYSSDPAQYLNLYNTAESVVSARLHASVVRRGFGLPVTNIWPESDFRCRATWAVVESIVKNGPKGLLIQYHDLLNQVTPAIKHPQ